MITHWTEAALVTSLSRHHVVILRLLMFVYSQSSFYCIALCFKT